GDLYYKDYKWKTDANHVKPKIISQTDDSELNRKDGYEMLYFINSLAKTWIWQKATSLSSYQHLEKIIRLEVPSLISARCGIMFWISANFKVI
ncbi:MAG: hypothetical protein ABI834_07365, partial [Ginsengibacter sp.]